MSLEYTVWNDRFPLSKLTYLYFYSRRSIDTDYEDENKDLYVIWYLSGLVFGLI